MMASEVCFNTPFFSNLSDREKLVLVSNASKIHFDEEEMFLKNGSTLYSLYYIHKGQVKIKDECHKLVDLLGEGDFLGLRYLYSQEAVFFSAYGTTNTEIVQIEKNVFKKFASTNTSFAVDLYNKSIENASDLVSNLLAFKKHKVHGALATFLLFYEERNCLFNLTQKEISEIMGYSRENVNKTLNDFIHEKYIRIENGNILILNREAIHKIQQYG